jgi:hypothetical protein
MIDLANTKQTRARAWIVSPADARAKLLQLITAVAEQRELDKASEETRVRVERVARLPAPAGLNAKQAAEYRRWTKKRAEDFRRMIYRFSMPIEARLYADKDGILRVGLDGIDRAIVNEPYEEIDRIRECQNTKCGRIFWAGRSTVRGKRVEGCSPGCLNILRLRHRDRPATEHEIAAVEKAIRQMNRAEKELRRGTSDVWQLDVTDKETISVLATRYAALPRGRVKEALRAIIQKRKPKPHDLKKLR